MANIKSRRGWREPRLYWHELHLGKPGFSGEPSMHQVRDNLRPYLEMAVFQCFHDPSVVANIESGGQLIELEEFWIGKAEDWRQPSAASLGNLIDRYATRLAYRLTVARWMQHWDQRVLKRLKRLHRIEGWLAQGTKGGISLYLRRHRRWKGGRYCVER